ncbi:hypothetical protein [Rhodococcus opacus]|uniref:Uncharacterized protein n=1 Tax=Rhodococcus opacus (strain B4) TaxID=632772 RepID=C1B5E8_RHOOB|nr:hypothetical protein [Rhodococcus opacus]BAH51074.1 hypothetical protein ROP_28270 [Rhodococcus opacus B4]
MNRNQPFVREMAIHIVHLHRAGETDKALNLRKQPQGVTVDDEQLHRALAQLYGLPDQSNEAMEVWVRSQYLADGRDKGLSSRSNASWGAPCLLTGEGTSDVEKQIISRGLTTDVVVTRQVAGRGSGSVGFRSQASVDHERRYWWRDSRYS